MAMIVGLFALLAVGVCCFLAAYEEQLSAKERCGDDLTRWFWNYLGPLISLGDVVLGLARVIVGGFTKLRR